MIGTAPRRGDGLDVGGRGLLVAGDGRGLGDVEDVELVMRDAATLGRGQLRGADVHAAVELHGVGVHDLARPTRSATASASADFPVPVGPTIAIGRRRHGCQTPTK